MRIFKIIACVLLISACSEQNSKNGLRSALLANEAYIKDLKSKDLMLKGNKVIKELSDKELLDVYSEIMELRTALLISKYKSKFSLRDIKEEAVLEYFDNNKSDYSRKELEVSHVFFRGGDQSLVAKEVLQKISDGALAFDEAVNTYSQDYASREKNGRIGVISEDRQRYHPLYVEILGSSVGDMKLITTNEGIHLVRLDDVTVNSELSEKIKYKLLNQLIENKLKTLR